VVNEAMKDLYAGDEDTETEKKREHCCHRVGEVVFFDVQGKEEPNASSVDDSALNEEVTWRATS
jgi:hypothetical protein